jgi:Glycosyl-hydrolase 97 N-terminal
MNPAFLLASLLSVGPAGVAPAVEVQSPSGDLVLTVGTEDFGDERGCPFYRLSDKGRTVLTDSRLGLDLEPDALASDLAITTVTRLRQDATWRPVCGEGEVVCDRYNAVQIDLMEKGRRRRLLRLDFRDYDEAVAFCYTLPEQPNVNGGGHGGGQIRGGWPGSDSVNGFQGLRVRLSFKPKPLTGSDHFNS